MKYVSVCPSTNEVWGVNTQDQIFKRLGISAHSKQGNGWKQIEGSLKVVSVANAGIWGVTRNDDLYYRTGTFKNQRAEGSGWISVGGKFKQISVGLQTVWGVNSNDDIFARTGISQSSPTGTGWYHMAGKLSFASVSTFNDNNVWGCTSSDAVFEQTNLTCMSRKN